MKTGQGQLLLNRQIRRGTRPILEEIDSLRTNLGNAAVTMLTPRAEVRLRSGEIASIPIQVRVSLADVSAVSNSHLQGDISDYRALFSSIALTLQFNQGYPEEPLEVVSVDVTPASSDSKNSNSNNNSDSNSSSHEADISENNDSEATIDPVIDIANPANYIEDLKAALQLEASNYMQRLETDKESTASASSVFNVSSNSQAVSLCRHLSGSIKTILSDMDSKSKSGVAGDIVTELENASERGIADESAIEETVSELSAVLLVDSAQQQSLKRQKKLVAKCKFCRHVVFEDPALDEHSAAHATDQGPTAAVMFKCTSIFLESLPPSVKDFQDSGGKITCDHCSSRLGQWSWTGVACSCRKWIVPGIQINLSKVDLSKI